MGVPILQQQQAPPSKEVKLSTMGLKLRMGLALSGLALSSMFGVNMLSGIKDYVDTTGNIMVDIADGIGMVSKGIEALEYYLDPTAEPEWKDKSAESTTTAGTPPPIAPATPGSPIAPPTPLAPGELPAGGVQPAVFCQKGKCYPYDPSKLKGVNLEATPGVIIQTVPPSPSPPHHKPTPASHKVNKANKAKQAKQDDDDDEDVKKKVRAASAGKSKPGRPKVAEPPVVTSVPVPDVSVENTTQAVNNNNNSSVSAVTPTKRLLSSVRGLLERLSKLMVKFVHRIFPWNRRARRRVLGD